MKNISKLGKNYYATGNRRRKRLYVGQQGYLLYIKRNVLYVLYRILKNYDLQQSVVNKSAKVSELVRALPHGVACSCGTSVKTAGLS